MKEMVGGCCVCSDERGWPDNPLVYCDGNGCTVAVHQACYGIIAVPTGPWFCRKCESPETKGKVRCELCPSKSGALKRSDTGGWAHVVCALYIPEVRFGNVTSMEPIVLRLIPGERFNKTCYICQDSNKPHRASAGACMQCNKTGCKQQFHVTCAQSLGLLCEEAGNYLDNVKYCGYCQHHYSKLKKGGNVKTIPPYKPVSHDSQSSDSSCDKDDDTSPLHSGSGTPTHAGKSKGPGRKSSHSSSAGKNQNNSSRTPTSSTQTMDKKKQSPARRGSSTGDGGSSKASTPAPSPQHSTEPVAGPSGKSSSGGSTPSHSKAQQPLTSPSPTPKPSEPVGVISSIATPTSATVATITAAPTAPNTSASTAVTTSVVQAPAKPAQAPAPAPYESVITNTELAETKQTKKRKAVSAANTPTPPVDYGATSPAVAQPQQQQQHQQNESMSQMVANMSSNTWDGANSLPSSDIQMEGVDKVIKKAKTDPAAGECAPQTAHFSSVSPAPPPPPPPPAPTGHPAHLAHPTHPTPAHSPASQHSQPSPRHLPSPMPGPSGMNMMSHIRSPSHSHHQVSSAPVDMAMPGPSPLMYHQPPKQAAMEPSMPGHSPHNVPGRSNWGGLNVSYEMQQDHSKPGVSGLAGPSKDSNMNPMNMTNLPMPPTTIRTKKRQAMASSVVSMASPQPTSTIRHHFAESAAAAAMAAQNLASMRRPPQPGPHPSMYHESIKESPPSSPSSDRPLRPKMESRMGGGCGAPHMLGNELNPESGAAARLQEQLSAELAAHAASGAGLDPLVPPPLINKAASGATSGRSSTGAQSLDQLLERQWEQGSQFLMEQAQHFDIASLLSCLHQLRTENVRLEEHVGSLLQRRDHLLAVNARLAIPLTTVSAGPPEPSRCPRESGPQVRAQPTPVRTETITSERSHQLLMRDVQQKPS